MFLLKRIQRRKEAARDGKLSQTENLVNFETSTTASTFAPSTTLLRYLLGETYDVSEVLELEILSESEWVHVDTVSVDNPSISYNHIFNPHEKLSDIDMPLWEVDEPFYVVDSQGWSYVSDLQTILRYEQLERAKEIVRSNFSKRSSLLVSMNYAASFSNQNSLRWRRRKWKRNETSRMLQVEQLLLNFYEHQILNASLWTPAGIVSCFNSTVDCTDIFQAHSSSWNIIIEGVKTNEGWVYGATLQDIEKGIYSIERAAYSFRRRLWKFIGEKHDFKQQPGGIRADFEREQIKKKIDVRALELNVRAHYCELLDVYQVQNFSEISTSWVTVEWKSSSNPSIPCQDVFVPTDVKYFAYWKIQLTAESIASSNNDGWIYANSFQDLDNGLGFKENTGFPVRRRKWRYFDKQITAENVSKAMKCEDLPFKGNEKLPQGSAASTQPISLEIYEKQQMIEDWIPVGLLLTCLPMINCADIVDLSESKNRFLWEIDDEWMYGRTVQDIIEGKGVTFRSADSTTRGRKWKYVGSQCSPEQRSTEQLGSWKRQIADRIEFLLNSEGSLKAKGMKEYFPKGLFSGDDEAKVIRLPNYHPRKKFPNKFNLHKGIDDERSQLTYRPKVSSREENQLAPSLNGIVLSYIPQIIKELGGTSCLLGLSTHEVCERFIKPRTSRQKGSYCDYLSKIKPEVIKRATLFVSHAWQNCFIEAMNALLADANTQGLSLDSVVIWFDLFSNNQHQASSVDQNWWLHCFWSSIGQIGQTVMIFSPWKNPLPLTRLWCLFEIFSTIQNAGKFRFIFPPQERKEFIDAVTSRDYGSTIEREGSGVFDDIIQSIDITKASTTKTSDQIVLKQIIFEVSSSYEVNKLIQTTLIDVHHEILVDYMSDMPKMFSKNSKLASNS